MKRVALLAMIFLMSSCAEIQESRRFVDRPVREYTTQQITSDPKHEAKVEVFEDKDGGSCRVRIIVSQHRDCEITSHAVVDRVEEIERTGSDMKKWYLISGGLALGAGGVGVAASTLDQMQENQNEYQATGALAGAIALGLLAYAIVNDVRAMDTTNHIGEITLNTPRKTTCEEGRGPRVPVELRTASGDLLLGGTTDVSGTFEGRINTKEILRLGPNYLMHIAGVENGGTEVLSEIYARLVARREDMRRKAELEEQERERKERRRNAAARREWEQAEEIRLRSEAGRIRRAREAVKVWDVQLLHKPDSFNSKVWLLIHFENVTYKPVIGVTTRVRIRNPFGKVALVRTFENEVELQGRDGIAESVQVENDSAWVFEELAFMSPDYRKLWKIAKDGTANIQITVTKVIFEDRTILR